MTSAQLYDYFAPLMQLDGGLGGTQRRWLETESAISKASSSAAESILKTTCLLNLGLSGERTNAPLELLKFAAAGYSGKDADLEIQDLIGRGLLLHRTHNDDVSVWHGIDLDLRGRLGERKARRQADFDLVAFLQREHGAPYRKPLKYNCEGAIQRFFEGRYIHGTSQLEAEWKQNELCGGLDADTDRPRVDGRVLYVICRDEAELEACASVAASFNDSQLLIAMSAGGQDLYDAAIEVQCLVEMQQDRQLLDADPLAQAELRQMSEDSRAYLSSALTRLTMPSEDGPAWYHRGEPIEIRSVPTLRSFLSSVMAEVFHSTPLILNENIVRHRPTPTIINSRRKLVLGILERLGQRDLGIEGNFPDAAMFRSVLLRPGLYVRDDGPNDRWRFADPEELSDRALAEVWGRVKSFFAEPEDVPKKPFDLLDELRRPPFGLRDGVLPILVAAGLRAFPSALAIMREGEYLRDLDFTHIEELCREPHRFRIVVFPEESAQQDCLRQVLDVFAAGDRDAEQGDLVRQAFDALQEWKSHLPPEALKTRQLSKTTLAFQRTITDDDPVRMLTVRLPTLMLSWGGPTGLGRIKSELESSGQVHYSAAEEVVRSVFPLEDNEPFELGLRRWAEAFPDGFVQSLPVGIERRALQTLGDDSATQEVLLDEMATLLVQRPVYRWHDYTRVEFDLKLGGLVNRLERALFAAAQSSHLEAEECSKILDIIDRRTTALHSAGDRITQIVGVDETVREEGETAREEVG